MHRTGINTVNPASRIPHPASRIPHPASRIPLNPFLSSARPLDGQVPEAM